MIQDIGHKDHDNCQNGLIYKPAGEITVLFTGNSSQKTAQSLGELDSSTSYVSMPRFYDNNDKEVFVTMYDRLQPLDLENTFTTCDQLVEASRVGRDRLQHPATHVEYIVDSHGNEYFPGDYNIVEGDIVWNGKRPGFDGKNQVGVVYSIRYLYKPYWIVKNVARDIRVSREEDIITGERTYRKMPISLVVMREYQFMNEVNNGKNDSARTMSAPESGGFGAR